MAPPMKRRRLFFWEVNEQPAQIDPVPSFSHTVTQLEPQPTSSSTTVEELHIEFRDRYLISAEERGAYLQRIRRQDAVSSVAETSLPASGTEAAPLSSTPTPSSVSSSASSTELSSSLSTSISTLPSSSASSTEVSSSLSSSATSSAITSTRSTLTSLSSSTSSTAISSTAVPNSSGSLSPTLSSTVPLGSANGNSTASFLPASLSGSIINTASPTSAGYNLTAFGSPFASNNPSSGAASGSLSLLATYNLTKPSSTLSLTESDGDVVATSLIYSTATISQNGQAVSTITTAVGVAGYGPKATPSTSSTTSTSGGGNDSRPDPPPPGTIAGGVVGGAAGLAVLLLVAMLFLRWYRRKRQLGHQPISPGSAGLSSGIDQGPSPRDGPGMAERAGLLPLAAAVPALFRHQNRGYPDHTLGPSLGPERGFQRVSGRKLPSAFSDGMVSAPTMPLVAPENNMSSTSFYNDRLGDHGGVVPNPFADRPGSTSTDTRPPLGYHSSSEQMTVVPGPERRPTIHAGGPYNIAPGSSQMNGSAAANTAPPIRTSGTAASVHRSETPISMEGSRESRFLEEV